MDFHLAQGDLDPNTFRELKSLQDKLSLLQETFAQFDHLHDHKYLLTWPDLLNKFNMLTAKFTTLSNDFYHYTETGSSATLPKLMLHPYNPTTTESETNILSILLRTKLIPDIEKLEDETKKAISHDLTAGTLVEGDHLIQQRYIQWEEFRKEHDQRAKSAARLVNDMADEYRDEILQRLEPEPAATSKEEWKSLKDPTEKGWQAYRLECMVNFCNNGKDVLDGSDLKKQHV